MTWDASLQDMKSALDRRMVDLEELVVQTNTAINCYTYEQAMDHLDRLCRMTDEIRDLFDSINEKEQEMEAEEYEKKWRELV